MSFNTGLILATLVLGVTSACVLGSIPTADESASATLAALVALSEAQATDQAHQWELLTYLATHQPGRAPTLNEIPTYTPYQMITGLVEIENGRCCAGGMAGQALELDVKFEAQSLAGYPVTEMRVRLGGIAMEEGDLVEEEWIPFRTQDMLIIEPGVNWTTYVLNVQFRDKAGNLSAVFSDEIAIEGSSPITPEP